MKLFTCSSCRQLLFFENVQCARCAHPLAYLPDARVVSALEPAGDGSFRALAPEASGRTYRLCDNYTMYAVCNWAVPVTDDQALCRACRLNEVIPNLAELQTIEAWQRLEAAKRRLLYTLLELALPIEPRATTDRGLAFSFLQDQAGEKIFTGHSDGLITINVAEADDPFREKIRVQLGEPYRTLLGHFRHEIGHYYWDRLIRDARWLTPFRNLFGDEQADYAEAMKRHYEAGPSNAWASQFVSAYASMHPWEDWAETFAHYLHMVDTLETARSYGLALRPAPVGGAPVADMTARRLHFDDFDDLISAWFPLTIALNSLNRGMGLPDLYPFVLSNPAIEKLKLVHDVVDEVAAHRR